MKKKMNILFLMILVFSMGVITFAADDEILVVASKDANEDSVSIEQVRDCFLGNRCELSKGTEFKALERKNTAKDLRARFYQQVAKMSTIQIKAYWSQRVFTGRGYPPPSADDMDAVKKELSGKKDIMTFIDRSELTPQMKILLTIK